MRLASIIRLLASIFLFYPALSLGQTDEFNDSPVHNFTTAHLHESDITEWLEKARLLNFSQPDSAMMYARYALEGSRKLGLQRFIAKSYKQLGNIQYATADFDQALESYQLSLEIFEALNDKEGIAGVLNNQGIIQKNLGNYPQAADVYYKSLEIAEKMDDNIRQARVHRNLGSVYFLQDDYQKGIASFKMSLQLLEGEQDPKGMAESLFNLGTGYLVEKKYEEAESSLLESMEYFEVVLPGPRMDFKRAEVFNNLGILHCDQENFQAARESHEKAIVIRDSLGDLVGLAESYTNLANVDLQQHEYGVALGRYEKAREIAQKTGSKEISKSVYRGLAETYKGMDDYANAYYFLNRYNSLRDSLFNTENIRRIANAEQVYQRAKQREVELIREKKFAEQKTLNYLLVAGLTVALLLMAVTLLMLRNYIIRQKALKASLAHKEQINRQIVLDLLHEHELETLDAHLEGREKERMRIATDLHDSLGGTLAAVQLSLSTLKKKMKGVADEALKTYEKTDELLDQAYKEMRRISHNLADGSLKEGGLKGALLRMQASLSENSSLKINLRIDELDQILLDREVELHLYRVIQELFQNIVKHAHANEVAVHFTRYRSKLIMTVVDDGRGFEYDASIENEGLGLQSIRSRVQQLNGEFNIDSSPEKGTEVQIEVPLDWEIV